MGKRPTKPVTTMRSYLTEMKLAPYLAPDPPETPLTILAALGPRMLALSAELADGAHPYNVPPEHTAKVRAQIGPAPWICVEQAVILEADATRTGTSPEPVLL